MYIYIYIYWQVKDTHRNVSMIYICVCVCVCLCVYVCLWHVSMRIFNLFMIPLRKIRLRAFVTDINNQLAWKCIKQNLLYGLRPWRGWQACWQCIVCQTNRGPSPNQFKTDIYVLSVIFHYPLTPLLKSWQKFTFDGQMVILFIIENIQIHHCICLLFDFTILDRFRTFRNIFFEKMWFCHLFSKYYIFKRCLSSLTYDYLISLLRLSTRFIVYAFCHIVI